MIERYTLPEMGKIWEPKTRFEEWLKVEIFACEAMAKLGLIPHEAVKKIKQKAKVDPGRIQELEDKVKHDVIAFVTSVSESMGSEGKYIHHGLTSSDLLDTALASLMGKASDILISDLKALLLVLKERSKEFKLTVMIGRSHGIHGEPITFGLKLALWKTNSQIPLK